MAKKKVDMKKIQKKVVKAIKEASTRLKGASKDTKEFLKRGEDEVLRVSKMGKAHFDILALSVKKEQLYRQIGMKVWQLSTKGKLTTKKLGTLCKELSDINKKVKTRKKALNKSLRTKK